MDVNSMRVAFICSAGGSSVFSAIELLIHSSLSRANDFVIVTDRDCAVLENAKNARIHAQSIIEKDNSAFSSKTAAYLAESNIDLVFLFFSRLVSDQIYTKTPTINVHESLLPMSPGFQATNKTINSGCKFLGVTTHVVNSGIDSGNIIGQVVTPIVSPIENDVISSSLFVMKTFLVVSCIDMILNGFLGINSQTQKCDWYKKPPVSACANPSLYTENLATEFVNFQTANNFCFSLL